MHQHFIFFYSHMRKADNSITSFYFFQFGSNFIGYGHRILKGYSFVFIRLHQSFHFCTKAEYTYLQAITFQYNIWFYKPFKHCSFHPIIGTYYREICHFEQTRHILQPKVELMIANGGSVVLHKIQHFDFYLTFKKIVVRSTLRKVSTVEYQYIRIVFTKLVKHGGTTYKSTHSGIFIGCMYIYRLYATVGITGLQQSECFSLLRKSRKKHTQEKQYSD